MRIDVLGVKIDNTNIPDAVERAMRLMETHEAAMVVTPNSEMLLRARQSKIFRATLNSADLVLPDGVGVIMASRILGTPIRERVAGVDFASALLARMSDTGKSVFLYGGRPGIAEAAAINLVSRYPGLKIVGMNDGYYTSDEDIIDRINAVSPDFLMVCLGSPKQERWMYENAPVLDVGVMAGLGGTLDVLSGTVQLAPKKWRELGFEWLYRLIKQPKRIKRVIKLPLILICAFWRRLTGR